MRLPGTESARPPRLLRGVGLQAAAIVAVALLCEMPWKKAQRAPLPEPAPKKEERRIRVVRLPRPPPPVAQPAQPRPAQPEQSPPQVMARAEPKRPPPPPLQAKAPSPALAAPRPTPPRVHIAADSTAVQGVRLRVLVPRSPDELLQHLRNSGGCLVVSRLSGEGAEVVSVLGVEGHRAVEMSGPPCNGVPRLLRDGALNAALGDPIGRARAETDGGELALQVLLSPRLHELAQSALQAHFGAISEEEMAQRAAASGYELTCFAEPFGSLRCQ